MTKHKCVLCKRHPADFLLCESYKERQRERLHTWYAYQHELRKGADAEFIRHCWALTGLAPGESPYTPPPES